MSLSSQNRRGSGGSWRLSKMMAGAFSTKNVKWDVSPSVSGSDVTFVAESGSAAAAAEEEATEALPRIVVSPVGNPLAAGAPVPPPSAGANAVGGGGGLDEFGSPLSTSELSGFPSPSDIFTSPPVSSELLSDNNTNREITSSPPPQPGAATRLGGWVHSRHDSDDEDDANNDNNEDNGDSDEDDRRVFVAGLTDESDFFRRGGSSNPRSRGGDIEAGAGGGAGSGGMGRGGRGVEPERSSNRRVDESVSRDGEEHQDRRRPRRAFFDEKESPITATEEEDAGGVWQPNELSNDFVYDDEREVFVASPNVSLERGEDGPEKDGASEKWAVEEFDEERVNGSGSSGGGAGGSEAAGDFNNDDDPDDRTVMVVLEKGSAAAAASRLPMRPRDDRFMSKSPSPDRASCGSGMAGGNSVTAGGRERGRGESVPRGGGGGGGEGGAREEGGNSADVRSGGGGGRSGGGGFGRGSSVGREQGREQGRGSNSDHNHGRDDDEDDREVYIRGLSASVERNSSSNTTSRSSTTTTTTTNGINTNSKSSTQRGKPSYPFSSPHRDASHLLFLATSAGAAEKDGVEGGARPRRSSSDYGASSSPSSSSTSTTRRLPSSSASPRRGSTSVDKGMDERLGSEGRRQRRLDLITPSSKGPLPISAHPFFQGTFLAAEMDAEAAQRGGDGPGGDGGDGEGGSGGWADVITNTSTTTTTAFPIPVAVLDNKSGKNKAAAAVSATAIDGDAGRTLFAAATTTTSTTATTAAAGGRAASGGRGGAGDRGGSGGRRPGLDNAARTAFSMTSPYYEYDHLTETYDGGDDGDGRRNRSKFKSEGGVDTGKPPSSSSSPSLSPLSLVPTESSVEYFADSSNNDDSNVDSSNGNDVFAAAAAAATTAAAAAALSPVVMSPDTAAEVAQWHLLHEKSAHFEPSSVGHFTSPLSPPAPPPSAAALSPQRALMVEEVEEDDILPASSLSSSFSTSASTSSSSFFSPSSRPSRGGSIDRPPQQSPNQSRPVPAQAETTATSAPAEAPAPAPGETASGGEMATSTTTAAPVPAEIEVREINSSDEEEEDNVEPRPLVAPASKASETTAAAPSSTPPAPPAPVYQTIDTCWASSFCGGSSNSGGGGGDEHNSDDDDEDLDEVGRVRNFPSSSSSRRKAWQGDGGDDEEDDDNDGDDDDDRSATSRDRGENPGRPSPANTGLGGCLPAGFGPTATGDGNGRGGEGGDLFAWLGMLFSGS